MSAPFTICPEQAGLSTITSKMKTRRGRPSRYYQLTLAPFDRWADRSRRHYHIHAGSSLLRQLRRPPLGKPSVALSILKTPCNKPPRTRPVSLRERPASLTSLESCVIPRAEAFGFSISTTSVPLKRSLRGVSSSTISANNCVSRESQALGTPIQSNRCRC
jgi:hypothetical protein